MRFEGVYSVLPTPFKAGGDVDVESLRRVLSNHELVVVHGGALFRAGKSTAKIVREGPPCQLPVQPAKRFEER